MNLSLRCIACVVEGTGFASAIARSALSATAQLVRPRKVPLAVLGSVSAGTTWMAPHVDMRDATGLARAVEALRGHLQAVVS